MATTITPRDELFLDTSFAVALSSEADQNHSRAWRISIAIEALNCRILTTRAVLLEIGNALSRLRYRASVIELLASLHIDPQLTILPLSDDLYEKAFELFSSRPDKEWGMVDCVSFVVMEQRGLTKALTADLHFEQAGFQALLKSDD